MARLTLILSAPWRIATTTAAAIAARLTVFSNGEEKWEGEAYTDANGDAGMRIIRLSNGYRAAHDISSRLLRGREAARLNEVAERLERLFKDPAMLVAKDRETPIHGPGALARAMQEEGRRGLSIQRYKGLGEMNPEQLWETTLDPEARTLLQVKVAHAEEAGHVFSTLMGEEVEPRRNFIQDNALKVANLDV